MAMRRPMISAVTSRVATKSCTGNRTIHTRTPLARSVFGSSSSASSSLSSVSPSFTGVGGSPQQSLFYHTCTPLAAIQQDNKNNSSRDTRLAGRRRFYKSVGVTSVNPPWKSSSANEEETQKQQVESPISAGVDGTQSASGVIGTMETSSDTLQSLLMPRVPGKVVEDAPSSATSSTTNWYGVTLDGRTLRTPLGQILAVPSQMLAWAIAAEWDSQTTELKPAQMPLMTLACTTLDQTVADPETYKSHILRYLSTDTTCYWADPSEDRVLHRKQQQAWKDLHEFCSTSAFDGSAPAKAFGANEGLLMSRARSDASKVSGLPHPDQVYTKAEEFVNTLDAWHLTALHSVTAEAKSFLVGMAVLLSHLDDGPHQSTTGTTNPFAQDVRKAVQASRVEEEFQIDNWGLVEGQHDYDRLNASIQLHSAHLLISSIANENF